MAIFGPPNVEKLLAKRDIPKLIKALGYKEVSVRKSAAQALGEIGDARAIEPLLTALKDEDFTASLSAADALGKIGTPAVEALVNVLGDERIRYAEAALALGKIGAPAVGPLSGRIEG